MVVFFSKRARSYQGNVISLCLEVVNSHFETNFHLIKTIIPSKFTERHKKKHFRLVYYLYKYSYFIYFIL